MLEHHFISFNPMPQWRIMELHLSLFSPKRNTINLFLRSTFLGTLGPVWIKSHFWLIPFIPLSDIILVRPAVFFSPYQTLFPSIFQPAISSLLFVRGLWPNVEVISLRACTDLIYVHILQALFVLMMILYPHYFALSFNY